MTKRTVAKTRARTKPRTERAEKGSHAAVVRGTEKPVDSEIERAAKRAGIKVPPPGTGVALKPLTREQAVERLCAAVGTKLVQASDMIAERIAAERFSERCNADYLDELGDLLDLIWEIRWDLGMLPEDVRVEATVLRKLAVTYEAAANAQPAGGAS
jgi:hypothetical protein